MRLNRAERRRLRRGGDFVLGRRKAYAKRSCDCACHTTGAKHSAGCKCASRGSVYASPARGR